MSLTRDEYISSPLPIARELRRLLGQHARVVFDIGSCEGEDALRYAHLFPDATTYAIEPLPRNIPLLRANLARYPNRNVRLIELALSDVPGTARFFVSSGQPPGVTSADWDYGNKSSSLLPPGEHVVIHPWVQFQEQIEVETDTLERVCQREGVTSIDLIHLDVQGAELKVLMGAGALLASVRVIWMEVEAIPLYAGQPLKADVERFMDAQGFRKIKDTVDAVAGDQLYVNPRLVRVPGPDPWESAPVRSLRHAAVRFRRCAGRLRGRLSRGR
jgi:FkbM family methyltransferase